MVIFYQANKLVLTIILIFTYDVLSYSLEGDKIDFSVGFHLLIICVIKMHKTSLSWIKSNKKKYKVDTNLNGEISWVVTGEMEKVFIRYISNATY